MQKFQDLGVTIERQRDGLIFDEPLVAVRVRPSRGQYRFIPLSKEAVYEFSDARGKVRIWYTELEPGLNPWPRPVFVIKSASFQLRPGRRKLMVRPAGKILPVRDVAA
jgi:hypothetical protein